VRSNFPTLPATKPKRLATPLDTYLGNVEQNDSRKIYRAKTPRRKVTLRVISTEGRNLFFIPSHALGMTGRGHVTWRALRLCARYSFSIPQSEFNRHFQISLASLLSKEAAESGNRLGHAHSSQSFQDPGLSIGDDGLAEVFFNPLDDRGDPPFVARHINAVHAGILAQQ
jgi:hypothetical protein